MTTNDPTVHVQAIQPRIPRWTGTKKMITIGAATVVAVASTAAVVQWSRAETEQPAVQTPAVPMTRDEKVQDLVVRGLIPAEALQPAPMTRDEKVQDLVVRGLIPAEALQPAP